MPTLYLDGVPTKWLAGSLSVDEAVDERSTVGFTVVDAAETSTVTRGTPVVIVDVDVDGRDVYIFNGVVDKTARKAVVTPAGGGIFVTLSCVDAHWYLDKRLAAEGYLDTASGAIVKDLVVDIGRSENIYDHPYPGTAVALARSSIVGYWRLAQDATDDSWHRAHGSVPWFSSPVYSSAPGDSPVGDDTLGGYATLDGTDDYIQLPSNAGVASGGGSWTVAAWVNKTRASAGECLWSEATAGSWPEDLLNIYVLTTDHDVRVAFDNTGGLLTGVGTTGLTEGNWHHVAVTYDVDVGKGTLYVDGAYADSFDHAVVPWISTKVQLGAEAAFNGERYNGSMAEVLAASRAFSADDVDVLYTSGRGAAVAVWPTVWEPLWDTDAGPASSRVSDGLTLTAFSANYEPVTQLVEELAELSGYDYFVDAYRTLHFHERGTACCTFPVSVTDTVILSGEADLSTEAPKYRNRQYVKGGYDVTAEQTELVEADGDQRSFLVGYALMLEPTVSVETGVGTGIYTEGTVGIRGVETGRDWYWSKGDFAVTQEPDDAVVAAGVRVKIVYFGRFDTVSISADTGEQISVAAIEKSGTGIVDAAVEDASVSSRAQGLDVATGKLGRFAQRGSTIRFVTRHAGYRPGQVGQVTFDRLGVDETVLIDTVETFDFDGIELRYRVSAITGPALTSWQQFFAKTAKRSVLPISRENVGEEVVITLSETFSETTTVTVSETPAAVACALLDGTPPTLGFVLC